MNKNMYSMVEIQSIVASYYCAECRQRWIGKKLSTRTMAGLVWWIYGVLCYFNNISVMSWRSILLVKETGISGEDHRHAASH